MLIQFVSLLLSVSHSLRCHFSVTCSSSIVARPWFVWAHNLTPLWCVLFWMFCRVSVVSLLLSKQRTHSTNIVGVLRFSYWSVITHLRHEPFYIHSHCWWFSATHPNVTYCCVPVKEACSRLNTQSYVNRMLGNAKNVLHVLFVLLLMSLVRPCAYCCQRYCSCEKGVDRWYVRSGWVGVGESVIFLC